MMAASPEMAPAGVCKVTPCESCVTSVNWRVQANVEACRCIFDEVAIATERHCIDAGSLTRVPLGQVDVLSRRALYTFADGYYPRQEPAVGEREGW